MALAKLTPLRFSTVHGQSVLMNETKSTSSWQISDHWGICTTNRALLKGEVIEMELTGSGHMYIGLLASKPSGSNVLEGRSPSRIAGDNWVHFRLKNNNFVIKLEKTSGKEVTFYSGGDNPVEVLKIADCWLCCDLLFGDIEVKLLTKDKSVKKTSLKKVPPLCFHSVYGPNINMSPNSLSAKLKHTNPSALCSTDRPITQGDIIEVKVESIEEARWIYVKIYLSNYSAKDLKIDLNDHERSPSDRNELLPLTTMKNSRSTIIIRVVEDGKVAYTVCGKENKCDLGGLDMSKSIYMYFELFRVKLTLTSVLSATPEVSDYPKIKDVHITEDDGYLTPIAVKDILDHENLPAETVSDYCRLPNNSTSPGNGSDRNSGSGGAEGASGPDPEIGITVNDISNHVADLRSEIQRGRTDSREDCSYYKGLLRDIRKRLVSIEDTSSNNDVILQKVKDLEMQLSVFMASQTKPVTGSPVTGSPSAMSDLECKIRKNYTRFVSDMEPDTVVDYLYEYGVVSDEQRTNIQGMGKAEIRGKNRQILQLVKSKGHKLELFTKALINAGCQDLANLLN